MTNKEAIKLLQQIEEDGWNVMNFHDEALYILEPLKKEKDGPQWTIEV